MLESKILEVLKSEGITNKLTDKVFYKEEPFSFITYIKALNEIDITYIYVDPKYRQKGYGYRLLNEFITNNPNSIIMLEVKKSNERAIKLYEKCSFTKIHIRKNYYKDEDAIIMRKEV
jgi:ribosomal-protein-alanine N-acetyltransferase